MPFDVRYTLENKYPNLFLV